MQAPIGSNTDMRKELLNFSEPDINGISDDTIAILWISSPTSKD